MVLFLLACMPPKDVQLAQLAAQGYPDLVCSLEEGAYAGATRERLVGATTVKLSAQVVPVEAFVVAPEGYGTEWWLVNLGLEQHGPADRVDLALSLPGYGLFALDPAFLASRYPQPPHDDRPEPSLGGDSHSDWGDFWKGMKVLGSLMVLPLTASWDLMVFMADLQDGDLGGAPYLTPHLALFALDLPAGRGSSYRPSFGQLVLSPGGGLSCDRDLCSAQLIVKPDPASQARLEATLHTESCHFQAQVELPATQGELETVLGALFPPEGAELTWWEGP